jgi:hypothetical protein
VPDGSSLEIGEQRIDLMNARGVEYGWAPQLVH